MQTIKEQVVTTPENVKVATVKKTKLQTMEKEDQPPAKEHKMKEQPSTTLRRQSKMKTQAGKKRRLANEN